MLLMNSFTDWFPIYLPYQNAKGVPEMAENKKNLCAMIPVELHAQVTQARTELGQTTNEYITMLITEYYKMKEKGSENTMEGMRTMAFQMPEEMFQRLKAHLERESARTGKKVSQKQFVLDLIRQALDEAERKEADSGADMA